MSLISDIIQGSKTISWKMTDRHYLSLWDARDLPNVEKWQEKIRVTHNEQLILDFYSLLDKKWNDHNNLDIEPLELSRKDDVVTYRGIGKMCRLVTNQNILTFEYVAVGTGAPADTNPMPFDQGLITEEAKVPVAENGFFEAAGTSLRYAGTFGEGLGSDSFNESLLRTHPNTSDTGNETLCIASFFDNPISHTQGNTGFSAAGSIEFNIIMDISQ